ncbi:hypothetical protein QUB13_20805 [Microcoleus sp. B4-D4]
MSIMPVYVSIKILNFPYYAGLPFLGLTWHFPLYNNNPELKHIH